MNATNEYGSWIKIVKWFSLINPEFWPQLRGWQYNKQLFVNKGKRGNRSLFYIRLCRSITFPLNLVLMFEDGFSLVNLLYCKINECLLNIQCHYNKKKTINQSVCIQQLKNIPMFIRAQLLYISRKWMKQIEAHLFTASWSIKVSIAEQKFATSTLMSAPLKVVTIECIEHDVTCLNERVFIKTVNHLLTNCSQSTLLAMICRQSLLVLNAS